MAKHSSLKIKVGQIQYEKQRKDLKIQALKVWLSLAPRVPDLPVCVGFCMLRFYYCEIARDQASVTATGMVEVPVLLGIGPSSAHRISI